MTPNTSVIIASTILKGRDGRRWLTFADSGRVAELKAVEAEVKMSADKRGKIQRDAHRRR